VELTDTAARALAVVRRDGRELRFAVDEICHSERYRLSVRYRAPSGEEVRLGLLYGTDEAALLALGEALAAGATPATEGAGGDACAGPVADVSKTR
jgi:hypothetical protein